MSENTFSRRLLLGAGALALMNQGARADEKFSRFIQAAGDSAAPTMPEIKNVRDFGATGNGTTDDTAAIQAAVDWTSSANRGTIYFPMGTYKTTSAITFERPNLNIVFRGEPGATIAGDFDDFLLKRSPNSPISGVHAIENLRLLNPHAKGRGVAFHSCVGGKIVNCHISAWRGIETFNSQSVLVDTCSIIAPGASDSSVGIMAGNATAVISTDVTGYHHGIRHQNVGLIVYGGRYEVNAVALMIGMDENGRTFQSSGFDISGLSMEANQTAIQIHAGAAGKISGLSIGGGIPLQYGLRLASAQDVVVQGVSVGCSKGFSKAGIAIENAKRTVLMAVSSNSPTAWLLPEDQSQLSFIQSNKA